jgi:hypothetical protein
MPIHLESVDKRYAVTSRLPATLPRTDLIMAGHREEGSVAGWPLDVIDHQDFRGTPARFQLQSQCFA